MRAAPADHADLTLSPAVRRAVLEHHVDPSKIKGTGKDGRADQGRCAAAAKAKDDGPVHEPAGAGQRRRRRLPSRSPRRRRRRHRLRPPRGERKEERVKMTRLRQTIATRLKEAQNTAALLTTYNDVDMSAVIDARARYKDLFEKKHGIRLGFMGFFVKAVALAARDVPSVNARIEGDEIVYPTILDVSVAVSAPKGLVVPVIRDADKHELRRDREGDRRLRQEGQGRHADRRRHEGRHLHHLQRRRVRLAAVEPDHQPAAVGRARHAPDRGAAGGHATARSSPGR